MATYSYTVQDSTIIIKDTLLNTLTFSLIPAEQTKDLIILDSTIQIKNTLNHIVESFTVSAQYNADYIAQNSLVEVYDQNTNSTATYSFKYGEIGYLTYSSGDSINITNTDNDLLINTNLDFEVPDADFKIDIKDYLNNLIDSKTYSIVAGVDNGLDTFHLDKSITNPTYSISNENGHLIDITGNYQIPNTGLNVKIKDQNNIEYASKTYSLYSGVDNGSDIISITVSCPGSTYSITNENLDLLAVIENDYQVPNADVKIDIKDYQNTTLKSATYSLFSGVDNGTKSIQLDQSITNPTYSLQNTDNSWSNDITDDYIVPDTSVSIQLKDTSNANIGSATSYTDLKSATNNGTKNISVPNTPVVIEVRDFTTNDLIETATYSLLSGSNNGTKIISITQSGGTASCDDSLLTLNILDEDESILDFFTFSIPCGSTNSVIDLHSASYSIGTCSTSTYSITNENLDLLATITNDYQVENADLKIEVRDFTSNDLIESKTYSLFSGVDNGTKIISITQSSEEYNTIMGTYKIGDDTNEFEVYEDFEGTYSILSQDGTSGIFTIYINDNIETLPIYLAENDILKVVRSSFGNKGWYKLT